MTESYVCPHCGRVEERPYRVRLIILTCADCGENGRFLHESIVARLEDVPEPRRPEDWSEMALDERLQYAVKEGLLDVSFTGPI
ncbi:hypothetical protein [Halobellus captivus]|uniref:hypothetical protein n=1 Tax=Halobellus captivus TaxID=2592614 RepID=UPI0011AA27E8|nr:hypothetical protein [Halobellus captivus]